MPQYPIPAWTQPYNPDRPRTRRTYGRYNHRFDHVAQFRVGADRSIDIIRCDPAHTDELRHLAARYAEDNYLHEGPFTEGWSKVYYAPRTRLGQWNMIPAEKPVWVGSLEEALYIHGYTPNADIDAAGTNDELLAALTAEVERVRAITADGWDLTLDENGVQIFIDTRRPDETLRPEELPGTRVRRPSNTPGRATGRWPAIPQTERLSGRSIWWRNRM